jgi:hypothetical protein
MRRSLKAYSHGSGLKEWDGSGKEIEIDYLRSNDPLPGLRTGERVISFWQRSLSKRNKIRSQVYISQYFPRLIKHENVTPFSVRPG